MAGALGVRLGGTNYYDGVASPKPFLNENGARPTRGDARAARTVVAAASIVAFLSAVGTVWRWRS
jgi:adenosylcobinamide-phosphate synthase